MKEQNKCAVMLAIRPKWCCLISNGEKTFEIRKSRPAFEPPFTVYIYCTDGRPLYSVNGIVQKVGEIKIDLTHDWRLRELNQTVIGEFVCDDILTINGLCDDGLPYWIPDGARLTEKEAEEYGKGKTLYGWHITNLRIYEAPVGLEAFTGLRRTKFGHEPIRLKRPPQSWYYVRNREIQHE